MATFTRPRARARSRLWGHDCVLVPECGWWLTDDERFEERDPSSIEVTPHRPGRGACREGRADAGGADRIGACHDIRSYRSGGWQTDLNDRFGVSGGDEWRLKWALDPDAGVGRDQFGREVALRPFLGVLGMPPPEPGAHSTQPPRVWAGTSTARSSSPARRCRCQFPSTVRCSPPATATPGRETGGLAARHRVPARARGAHADGAERPRLRTPLAWTPLAWLTFGFDEDLDEAAAIATDAMLELMDREYGLERRDALALASLVVDLRVTQLVNGVRGVHAMLCHDAIRFEDDLTVGYEFKLPDLGEGLTEGEARWLVVEGQEIAEDDPLVEIQTDKATVEVPSPAAGVVTRIHVREGGRARGHGARRHRRRCGAGAV